MAKLSLFTILPWIDEVAPGSIIRTRKGTPVTFTHIERTADEGDFVCGTTQASTGRYQPVTLPVRLRVHAFHNVMLREV